MKAQIGEMEFKESLSALAVFLLRMMEKKSMSSDDLANKTGLDFSLVESVLRGEGLGVRLREIVAITEALDCRVTLRFTEGRALSEAQDDAFWRSV